MKPAALLLLALSCARSEPAPATHDQETNETFIKSFLSAWLVADDGSAAKYLSERFDIPVSDRAESIWPASLRSLPPKQRALAFALSCSVRRSRCNDLQSCIRRAVVTESGLYDVQRVRVTNEIAKDFPSLRDLVGHDVLQVVFMLRECNIACYVIMEASGRSVRRVRSVTYMALDSVASNPMDADRPGNDYCCGGSGSHRVHAWSRIDVLPPTLSICFD